MARNAPLPSRFAPDLLSLLRIVAAYCFLLFGSTPSCSVCRTSRCSTTSR